MSFLRESIFLEFELNDKQVPCLIHFAIEIEYLESISNDIYNYVERLIAFRECAINQLKECHCESGPIETQRCLFFLSCFYLGDIYAEKQRYAKVFLGDLEVVTQDQTWGDI